MSFSEFSYGFALTHELVAWAPLSGAPIFPSLYDEGKKLGWDVKLGEPAAPLYLQFKRAQPIQKANGKESKLAHLMGIPLKAPYHRFPITQGTVSKQHTMLLELEDAGQLVFYAAPRFHELEDLDAFWKARAVADNTIFVPPGSIGTLDNNPHAVAFNKRGAWCFSEPFAVEALSGGMVRERLIERLNADKRPLEESVMEFRHDLMRAERRGRRRTERGRRISDLERLELALSFDDRGPIDFNIGVTAPSPAEAALTRTRAMLEEMARISLGAFDTQLFIVQRRTPD